MFNTYILVRRLMAAGWTEEQAVVVMDALLSAMSESLENTSESLVSRGEFVELKSMLSEKLFNSSLKYDLQQKHLREVFKSETEAIKSDMVAQRKTWDSELSAFRSDVRMTQKTELFALQQAVAKIEKERENEWARYKSEHEQLENRLIKYALGFVASFGALVLTGIRLLSPSSSSSSSSNSSPPQLPPSYMNDFPSNYHPHQIPYHHNLHYSAQNFSSRPHDPISSSPLPDPLALPTIV